MQRNLILYASQHVTGECLAALRQLVRKPIPWKYQVQRVHELKPWRTTQRLWMLRGQHRPHREERSARPPRAAGCIAPSWPRQWPPQGEPRLATRRTASSDHPQASSRATGRASRIGSWTALRSRNTGGSSSCSRPHTSIRLLPRQ